MSVVEFFGGKSESLHAEYSERRKFLDFLRSTESELDHVFMDTLYGEKLYGRINQRGEATAPTPEVKRFGQYAASTTGLNYVVDLFNNFRNFYLSSDNFPTPEKLTGLVPKKNFVDFERLYQSHELRVVNKLLPLLVEHFSNQPVIYFEDFARYVNDSIFTPTMASVPFTKSGFSLSDKCSVYATGLYIDFSPSTTALQDQEKVDILSDPAFPCFSKIAYEYGFLVDAHCPWRLIANLDSPATKSNILNGRSEKEFDNFYADVYTSKVGLDDYWALKTLYENMFLELMKQLDRPAVNYDASLNVETWLGHLLTHRFKELGLFSIIQDKDYSIEYSELLQKAIETNSRYGLTSNFGALNLIVSFFGEKTNKLKKEGNDFTNPRHREQLQGDLPGQSNYIGTI